MGNLISIRGLGPTVFGFLTTSAVLISSARSSAMSCSTTSGSSIMVAIIKDYTASITIIILVHVN